MCGIARRNLLEGRDSAGAFGISANCAGARNFWSMGDRRDGAPIPGSAYGSAANGTPSLPTSAALNRRARISVLEPLTPSSIRLGDTGWGSMRAGGDGCASEPTEAGGYWSAPSSSAAWGPEPSKPREARNPAIRAVELSLCMGLYRGVIPWQLRPGARPNPLLGRPVDATAFLFGRGQRQPSFFFSVPDKMPRTVWRCQPVALAISSTVAPLGAPQHRNHRILLRWAPRAGFRIRQSLDCQEFPPSGRHCSGDN
jgi:hypothetical protein